MDSNATASGFNPLSLIGTILAWLAAGVSALLSWRVASAKREGKDEAERDRQEERDEGLRQDLIELRDDLRASVAEMRTLTVANAKREGQQDAINAVTAKTLEGLALRIDRHEQMHARIDATLNEHGSSLTLLRTLMEERAKREGAQGSL